MHEMPNDTSPKAEAFQINLLRKASISRRFGAACSLTQSVRFLSKRAIQRAKPGLAGRELDLKFVEVSYGMDLAQKVEKYLESRHCEQVGHS